MINLMFCVYFHVLMIYMAILKITYNESAFPRVMAMPYLRVPTLPGKPGFFSFSFQGLENVWNFLKSGKNLEF